MNILVTNDDGIDSQGIEALVAALAPYGNIAVVAPHKQRSAKSHGITVGRPVELRPKTFKNARWAFVCDGLPVDCVKLGLTHLKKMDVAIDVVFSGINEGGNLGTDTLYSGTVAAAIEGALCGKPSVAVSVNSHTPRYFAYAAKLAADALKTLESQEWPQITLNINTPDLPADQIHGVKYTRLGVRGYDEWLEPIHGEDGKIEYQYQGRPLVYSSKNTGIDVIANQENYASITPMQCDFTQHTLVEEVKKWRWNHE